MESTFTIETPQATTDDKDQNGYCTGGSCQLNHTKKEDVDNDVDNDVDTIKKTTIDNINGDYICKDGVCSMPSLSASDYKLKGNEAYAEKRYNEAIAMFTTAINLEENHIFYSNRSASYFNINKLPEALSDAEKCVTLNPSWVKGYCRKGAALQHMKRYDDAIDAYKKGLEIDPENCALRDGLKSVMVMTSATDGDQGNNISSSLTATDASKSNIFSDKILNNEKLNECLNDDSFMKKMEALQKDPSGISKMWQDPQMIELCNNLLGSSFPSSSMDLNALNKNLYSSGSEDFSDSSDSNDSDDYVDSNDKDADDDADDDTDDEDDGDDDTDDDTDDDADDDADGDVDDDADDDADGDKNRDSKE